ncbi:putative metallo-beta-lactamase domain protein [Microthyrium microscopicum]|uniref:Putative metallo-beta-lactamase domain protein n=1 Tax=Microthyrium microscopicum TaxID=703497 RepID=A0A6A6UAA9_9PEZI|nr:putative metallo-beta-lactamase domain protein [Microthyrium microscopicum]
MQARNLFTARKRYSLKLGAISPKSEFSSNQRLWYKKQVGNVREPIVHDVFESKTGSWQYVVVDRATSVAVIIDPVLDYDPITQKITTTSADSLLALIGKKEYKVDMILETHAHADHLSAASYLQHRLTQEQEYRPSIGIGKRIEQVQRRFGERYGIPAKEYDSVFDKAFEDDEEFAVGSLKAIAIHIPGHTPDHMGYKIGDNIFCGDSIFHIDIGSARADFPDGSATDLFKSGRKLLTFPDHVKIWTGHDYPPKGRLDPVPYMTVAEHRRLNKHLMDGMTEEEFVKMRQARDKTLAAPKLIHQSLQMNIRGGKLPAVSNTGQFMLHLPLKLGDLRW